MRKVIDSLFHTLRDQLSRGVWPPDQRVLVDAYVALDIWRATGSHVFRLRAGLRSPPLNADLQLGTAAVRREGQLYVMGRRDWMVVARTSPMHGYDVAPGRTLAFRDPLLCYCSVGDGGQIMSGYINLKDQPTPRDLSLRPGATTGALGELPLSAEDVGTEGVRLAQTLPWFFAQA